MDRIGLELWFDFSCPYAYLASQRAHTLGVPIAWCPMLLGGVFRGTGAGDGPMATLSPAKAAHNVADMHRWARRFGVPFSIPAAHPMRTVRALRTLLALPEAHWPAAIAAIFAAYWQRGEDITQASVLAAVLSSAGIDAGAANAAIAAAGHDAVKQALHVRTARAIELGIFGAPAWRYGDTLVWGQDRFAWLEAMIAGWNPDRDDPSWRGRPFQPTRRGDPRTELTMYFDVASPFGYLGLTQAAALGSMRLVPILLGGLFRDIGQVDVPLLAMPPAKARYVSNEMQRWGRWWNVAFEMPRKFPQRTITAQRLIALSGSLELAVRLGRAMWAEQRDLEDEGTLAAILAAQGLDAALLPQTRTQEAKQLLIANTAEARAAGVFGVPTFVVRAPDRAPQLFWGQDRLELVAEALAQ